MPIHSFLEDVQVLSIAEDTGRAFHSFAVHMMNEET